MKFYKFFSVTAALLLVFFVSLTSVSAKDEWVKTRSKNFQLVGSASETELRTLALKLEQFRETFQQFFVDVNLDAPIPLSVVVLKSQQLDRITSINQKATEQELNQSYLQNEEAGKYIVVSVENDDSIGNSGLVYHEYVHFLLNEHFGRSYIQPWFYEGLAQYFEAFQSADNQKQALEKINNERLLFLRQNKLIPLESFFEMDYYSLQKQGNHGAGLFYAQSWALMHYLMRGENSAKNTQFNKFIKLVTSGKRQRYAFAETFQIDYEQLERELKKYIDQNDFRADVALFTNKLKEVEVQSASATEAEAKIIFGDLLYQSGQLTEAEAVLVEAAKFNATASRANSLLGLVKLKQGKADEAKKHLEQAIALDDKNYLAHYRYAYVLSREGMTDYGFVSNYTAARAELIRAALDKAISLNPNFLESYNLYAFVNYVRNENIDRAIEYIERALKFAPGNERYQMRAAELALLKMDFGKARHIARKTFETAWDERLRVYAKNAIHTIDVLESSYESIKNPRRKRLYEVTDQPLSEEESARLNWLAMLQGINQNLRRLKPDEKRVLGYLTRVECGAGGIEYVIKTGDQILKLNSENFDSVTLVSYIVNASSGQIGCGTVRKDDFAVIGFRPAARENGRSAGEIISIEFVPEKFTLQN